MGPSAWTWPGLHVFDRFTIGRKSRLAAFRPSSFGLAWNQMVRIVAKSGARDVYSEQQSRQNLQRKIEVMEQTMCSQVVVPTFSRAQVLYR